MLCSMSKEDIIPCQTSFEKPDQCDKSFNKESENEKESTDCSGSSIMDADLRHINMINLNPIAPMSIPVVINRLTTTALLDSGATVTYAEIFGRTVTITDKRFAGYNYLWCWEE